MGNVAARPARTAPARYVAKQLPRAPQDVEEEFAKAKLTIQGINRMKERINTSPQPYIETKAASQGTKLTDMAAPRWYMNTWMELMDNTRKDRHIVSAQFPLAWNRDHNEPYSLVRNRIDDEDLDWLLTEGKKMPIEELVKHTKLEREVLEDIIGTIEAPRKQYRNYQGKLHRAIEDTNTFMADRSKRMEESRNEELLRQIGYSDEELDDEKQYMTTRSRGVKTLDDLGASIRRKKRLDRFAQANDMEILLEERRLQAIEAGTYEPTEQDLQRPEHAGMPKGSYYKSRFSSHKNMLRLDMSHSKRDAETREKITDWLEARKKIEYGKDKFPDDMPVYNEILSQSETDAKASLEINAARAQVMARAQGQKRWSDPRQQYDTMLKIMRESNQTRDGTTREVFESLDRERAAQAEGAAGGGDGAAAAAAAAGATGAGPTVVGGFARPAVADIAAAAAGDDAPRRGYTPKAERTRTQPEPASGAAASASTPPKPPSAQV
jgi:hypothetical protein